MILIMPDQWRHDVTTVARAARHQETAWPAVLVLDSTEFMWTNPRTGTSTQLFAVLAAYGYEAQGRNGRLWKLWASPTDDQDHARTERPYRR